MAKNKKLKHETIGQIRYYWNLLLFARQFEVEVDAPPEVVAEQFRDVEVREGDIILYSSDALVIEALKSYMFTLKVIRGTDRSYAPRIKATGKILYSVGYEKTIIRGNIQLAGKYILGKIAIILFFIVSLEFMIPGMYVITVIIAIIYVLLQIPQTRYDYIELRNQLQQQINKAIYYAPKNTGSQSAQLPIEALSSNDYYESAQE